MQKLIILLKRGRHYLLQIIQAMLSYTDAMFCFVTIKKNLEAHLPSLNQNTLESKKKTYKKKNEILSSLGKEDEYMVNFFSVNHLDSLP